MLTTVASDVALLIAAIGTALASVIGGIALVITALRTGQIRTIVKHVSNEVTTLNGKSIAVLTDEGETRRIDQVPKVERTPDEKEHLLAVPSEEGTATRRGLDLGSTDQ